MLHSTNGLVGSLLMIPIQQPRSAAETAAVPLPERRTLLRAFRKQFGITLVELGNLADISHPMLSQFERGDRDLSSEAWARVLQAMGKLLREDEERRGEERAKARETAAKLGVKVLPFLGPLIDSAISDNPFILDIFKTDEEFAKEKADLAKEAAELETESARLSEVGKLSAEIWRQATDVEANDIAKDPAAIRKVLEAFVELLTSVERHNRKTAELEAQGYVLLPKAVEKERDQLRARLNEAGSLTLQLTSRVDELEQELERERAKNDEAANA
jgi:transcriptional regulator with XRE-family HTH domain